MLEQRGHVWRALLLVAAGFCGLAGLLVEYGLPRTVGHDRTAEILSVAAVTFFVVELALSWRMRRNVRHFLRQRWPAVLLTVLLAAQLVVVLTIGRQLLDGHAASWLHPMSLTQLFLAVLQFYVVGLLVVNLPRLHSRFTRLRIRPGLAFLLVFLVAILCGSGLLCLPEATPASAPISYLDALFTSTSAVCVTGLIVRDPAAELTRFGHVVILALIQLGGLGVMSVAAALALLLGRGIGIRESSLMREVFQVPMLMEVGQILRFIVLWTLGTEALGAVVLYGQLESMLPDRGERLFCAVFHAVSAFCNAGFSTFPDSLVSWSGRPLALGTVAALLVIGGLGFTVVLNLVHWVQARGRGLRRSELPRLRLQTRVVLGWTAGLLLAGTVLIGILEWRGALAGLSWSERLAQAVFQSATCRTAGFNSLDLAALGPAVLFVMILLMFIGAGSGSTAGGVKITTLAVIAAEIRAIGSGRRQARIGDRELDPMDRQRATVVLTAGAVVAAAGTFLLLITEHAPFMEVVFETVSALGTVGLSLGLTPQLSAAGKVVVVVLMFVGRLGVLTFAYGLVKPGRDASVRLPRGGLMIG